MNRNQRLAGPFINQAIECRLLHASFQNTHLDAVQIRGDSNHQSAGTQHCRGGCRNPQDLSLESADLVDDRAPLLWALREVGTIRCPSDSVSTRALAV